MTPLVRWATAIWACAALVVLAFVDHPMARWLVVVPVLVFGPGVVAARFVSPDDGRYRPTIALVAGLATLVIVSQVFVLSDRFSGSSVAAVLAALTVVGAVVLPDRAPVSALPPRRPLDPDSSAARRLRAGSTGRSPIRPPADPIPAERPAVTAPGAETVYAVISPTLGAMAEVAR